MNRIIAVLALFWSAVSVAKKEGIQLLPHQKFPIDYLIKNSDSKGLVVNHYMGTGKTYLGVGFAEQFSDKSVVILAPRFIEAHWRQHLRDFPAKDLKRYQFVSYNDAPKLLLNKDLTNTIVIMDEVHNLIKMIKSPSPEENRRYSDLYVHLRSAFKILALSGTPIYNDEYDFAYLINLVSGKNLMPFNEEQFRIDYTRIKKGRSFWRGYVFESNILKNTLPTFVGLSAIPLGFAIGPEFAAPIAIGGAIGSVLIFPVVTNWISPVETHPLRDLDTSKFAPLISQYVSFYEIENMDLSDFPSKTMHVEEVSYNAQQFWFFLNFAEKSLANKGLARIYKDIDPNLDEAYLTLNTTILQNRLANTTGSGREIGNFEFESDDSNRIIEAPKFEKVLQKMKAQGMPKSVIYSNYFENGTLAFARFLDRKGLTGSYAVLRPDLPAEKFAELIQKYNDGTVKILLLHPEITEGISLKGTRQFHVLEPVTNLTVLNQVVARAVRYQSHAMLIAEERHVDVFVWKAVIGSMSFGTLKLQKANWFKRYSEMSDWSNFGQGISQIDKNYDRKRLSPDTQSHLRLDSVNQNIDHLKLIMKDRSIEKSDPTKKVQLEETGEFSDAQEALDLDPIMLPKTNVRTFWNLDQTLVYAGKNYGLKNGFGINIEFEVPLWEHFATGFYLEDYWGQRVKAPVAANVFDLVAQEVGQNVLGFGTFAKLQFRLPKVLGNAALSLRSPLGVEIILGKSLVPLIKDQADANQYLKPGFDLVQESALSGLTGYGVTTGLSLGFEYFPMEFAGLYVDGGYRASFHAFSTSVTLLRSDLTRQDTYVGFRGYLTHGWNVSTGLKLTY